MSYSLNEIREIVKRVLENDFETNNEQSLMYIKIQSQTVTLNDSELEEIM